MDALTLIWLSQAMTASILTCNKAANKEGEEWVMRMWEDEVES